MNAELLLVLVTVLVALAFDFLNGFHDAANSIATVVSTRVLSPKLAVVWAAMFNFLAAFFLGTAVAKTIGHGMIRLEHVNQYVVIAGLVGAIIWDLLTWVLGLPTSSSHALIGDPAFPAVPRLPFLSHIFSMAGSKQSGEGPGSSPHVLGAPRGGRSEAERLDAAPALGTLSSEKRGVTASCVVGSFGASVPLAFASARLRL